MRTREDLSDRCLVLTSGEGRWREILLPGGAMVLLPDGRSLSPVRIDPQRGADLRADETLDLLEHGAAVVVDLVDLPASAYPLLSWHARVRPRSVLLLRHGDRPLPLELREHAVRPYDPADGSGSRLALAFQLVAAVHARARRRPGIGDLSRAADSLAHRRRRDESGVSDAVLAADRAMLEGDRDGATAALERAIALEPKGADLLLRVAVLHRDAGRWREAEEALRRALAVDRSSAPAWRELGVVRERAGLDGFEEAFRRAAETLDDYEALVSLSRLAARRGEHGEALRRLEAAQEAAGNPLNLVLPVLTLRAAFGRSVHVSVADAERLRLVLQMRRAEAEAEPPRDAPWSCFDAAQAALLLGDEAGALALARCARGAVAARWEAETFGRTLDALELGGLAVAPLREALGLGATCAPRAATPAADTAAPPFLATARPAAGYARIVSCAAACPVGTDAGAYVALAADGRFADAYRVARGPNPFATVCGRVCAAPCEAACRRGSVDAPVAIRAVKRFVTERHGPGSGDDRLAQVLDGSLLPAMEGEAYVSHLRKLGAGGAGGRRVAVVGGGPAGLACAHDLALLGHRVTLYEASSRLGGMMRHGIPEFRLPREVLDRDLAVILALGVEVRLDEGLSASRTLASVRAEGAEAVFLASGASRGRGLDAAGANLDGVVRAIEYLININNGFRMDLGRRVVVVGGGSVSIDVARTARLGRPPDSRSGADATRRTRDLAPRLGDEGLRSAVAGDAPREVHLVARPPLGEWPAQKTLLGREEVEEARREGVMLHPLRGVRRILGESGRVTGVELAEVVGTADDGRATPILGAHAAETIPCDSVLLAIGQQPDLDYLEGTDGIARTPEGFIQADPGTLATSIPWLFAGGDAAFGPRTLIDAVSEGKRAARAVHAYLTEGRRLPRRYRFEEVSPREAHRREDYDSVPRTEPPSVAVGRRTGISEVEGSYDEAEVRRQAARCLSCHTQTVYDGTLCVACGRCTEVCPYACLSLVSPEHAEVVGIDWAARASEAGASSPVLMLKDESRCVRCGLCAERCPTGAMTMEKFSVTAGEEVA